MSITRRFLKSASLTALVLACGVSIAAAEVIIVERGPMPPPRVEVIKPTPGPGWNWVPGHWVWARGHWEWIAGHHEHLVVPPMPVEIVEVVPASPGPGYIWIKGHHAWEGGRWVWHRGVWVR